MAGRTWQREPGTPAPDTLAEWGLDFDLEGQVYTGCEIQQQGAYDMANVEKLGLTIQYKAIPHRPGGLEHPLYEGR